MIIQFPKSPSELPEYVKQLNESLSREPQKVVSLDERRADLMSALRAYHAKYGPKKPPPEAA